MASEMRQHKRPSPVSSRGVSTPPDPSGPSVPGSEIGGLGSGPSYLEGVPLVSRGRVPGGPTTAKLMYAHAPVKPVKPIFGGLSQRRWTADDGLSAGADPANDTQWPPPSNNDIPQTADIESRPGKPSQSQP